MMSVDYQLEPNFDPSEAQFLFEGHFAGDLVNDKAYDVAEDGRFIMIKKEVQEDLQIRIVENWFNNFEALTSHPQGS